VIGNERILLVDDLEANLVALQAILSPLRKTLVRARSGPEAMKALLRHDYVVVLLDVVMPGMDGFETAAHIKRLHQTKDIPIIFLTGADSDGDHPFRGYAAGAVDFLTKPFDPWVLRAKVQVFIDLHRKNRQLQQQSTMLRSLVEGAAAADEGSRRMSEFSFRLAAVEEAVRALGPAGEPAPGGERDLRALAGQIAELRAACEGMAAHLTPDPGGSD
jgi:CheY-like chemotaxis protein